MRGERGFTLIELAVALMIAAGVLLLAHRVFGSLLDGAARLTDERERLDHYGNARRLLITLVGSMDVGTPLAGSFDGEPHRLAFSSWCASPEGWPERRHLTLEVDNGRLVVSGLRSDPLPLADGVVGLDVDYLLSLGAGEHWGRAWVSPVSAPQAIRLRVAHASFTDTLLLAIGERG